MDTKPPTARTLAAHRLVIVALAGALALAFLLGTRAEPTDTAPPRPNAEGYQYVAGENRIYRISDNGTIEYLIVDFAHGSVEGIPGWARLRVDTTLTRDRMGNIARGDGN